MRISIIIGVVALALGCATTGQNEQKSQALSAQDQAQQSLQAAADAQKRAAGEQQKAEADQQKVEEAQRALASAQAELRGQRMKAQQAQEQARQLSQEAQQDATEQQQQALQLQQQQAQRYQDLNAQHTQSWTKEQTVEGRVVQASGDHLRVRTQDQGLMSLDVSSSTAITGQVQPGADVRASYQLIDGKAKALKIEVLSDQHPGQENLNPPPPAENTPNPNR